MTVRKYSKRSAWIHWSSAGLIFLTIPVGLAMSETTPDAAKLALYWVHIVTGGLVFALAIFHIYVYFTDERPPPLVTGSPLRDKLAAILHRILTILILVLTGTGVGAVFATPIATALSRNDYQLLASDYDALLVTIHQVQGIVFLLLIILHIGGVALYNLRYDQRVFRRMRIKP